MGFKDPQVRLEYGRAWRAAHREELRLRARADYYANKEKRNAASVLWAKKNRDRINKRRRQMHARDRDRLLAARRARRAAKIEQHRAVARAYYAKHYQRDRTRAQRNPQAVKNTANRYARKARAELRDSYVRQARGLPLSAPIELLDAARSFLRVKRLIIQESTK